MAKLVIILACVVFVQIASALQCYNCNKEKCDNKDTWETPTCSKSADPNSVPACLKNVYKDQTTKKETVVRKCVYVTNNEPYKCISVGEQIVCETCEKDLCNSASNLSMNFFTVTGIVVAFLVPKMFA